MTFTPESFLAKPAAMNAELASTSSSAPSATVLFVDDEPSVLSALRRLFRPQGYKVLMAEGGKAGLAVLAQETVDLVISDMRMPEMDGVQFLEQVRQRWPHAVRVMLTGYADITSTIEAINRGEIHRYIAKPWDDQDILLTVSDGLNRQRLERENRELIALTQSQNDQLQKCNQDLEARVSERTQALEVANSQMAETNNRLADSNAQLEKANQQLEENFSLSISVFSGLLELRDGSVSGHGHRVGNLSRRLAEKMGLGAIEVTDIYNAGLLHEIGKIGLPDALLNKPVYLMTGDEFEKYKRHPQNAQASLMPLGRLRQTAVIIRSQHERVDGQGFPDGLSGYEVPLGSQIVNLASTFEGLTSGRLAERVFSTKDAANAVLEGRGSKYDDEVMVAFEAVLKELVAEALADVEVSSADLRPGMVLTRPLLSLQGSLLLPASFRFTPAVIKQIIEFEGRFGKPFTFFVKQGADPEAAKNAATAATAKGPTPPAQRVS
jgi:response regulator RpfG family c-di-GMP phosphodiesterase